MAPLIYPVTKHDADQVIQYVYDEATQTLRTTATAVIIGQPIEVEIDMATDSIRLGDGTNFFTSHTVGPSTGLDVYIINPSIEVTATDLDIRDLSHTIDSVRLGDGTNFLTSTTVGADVGLDVNIINTVPISGNIIVDNFPNPVDTNYGVVGVSTIRTAAQIGNATGAADFNAGITTPQTLRVVLPTDQTAIPSSQSGVWSVGRTWVLDSTTDDVTVIQGTSPWVVSGTVVSGNDTNYGVVGANTLRTASQIGNATGAASFNTGTTTAQTLRVVLPTDQSAIPVSDINGDYAATSVLTQVTRTNASTTIKAANANRKGLILVNDSSAVCYVAFGGTATSGAYTFRMTNNEVVSLDKNPIYTGIVTGIWASNGGGAMMVTELT